MSYDKNTSNISTLDFAIEMLKDLNIPYKCKIIGKVQGVGLNDPDYPDNYYNVRRLTYGNFVILEQMIRERDCDFDDFITSSKFTKDKEPDNWQIEIVAKDEDYDGNYEYDWWDQDNVIG